MDNKTGIPIEEPTIQLTLNDFQRLKDYRWDMTGFTQKEPPDPKGISFWNAERIFQLDPAPEQMEDSRAYMIAAREKKDLRYISFFLHAYEAKLNQKIHSFLNRNSRNANDPKRFLDWKLCCMEVILKKFLDYDPEQCAAFETYLDRFLRDTLLACQMREEAWSLSSLSVYKGVRLMAAIYAKTSGDGEAAIDEFMQRTACTKETAEQYLKTARGLRSRQGACFSEDSEEDVACIDSGWRVSEWVWDGIRANAIQKAFWKLSYRDQILLERRSAICMGCGRVGSPSQRYSYEQLSALIQAGTDKAAERAYKRAVKRLETSLIASKAVRLVKLKCVGKAMDSEKIVSAVYRYQADCDGEWGEIHLDFKQHCGEIRQLADWDTTVSHVYASEAIRYLFRNYKDGIPDEATVPFDVV